MGFFAILAERPGFFLTYKEHRLAPWLSSYLTFKRAPEATLEALLLHNVQCYEEIVQILLFIFTYNLEKKFYWAKKV